MQSEGSKETVTVTEAATVLRISRGLAYACANRFLDSHGAEGLPVVRLGRRLVVPVHQLGLLLRGERSLGPQGVSSPTPTAAVVRESPARQQVTTTASPTPVPRRRTRRARPQLDAQLSLFPVDRQA